MQALIIKIAEGFSHVSYYENENEKDNDYVNKKSHCNFLYKKIKISILILKMFKFILK
jgi:hypothetical protein